MQWLVASGEWLWHMALNHFHSIVLLLASLPFVFGSVETGADIPHDWFGGTLTEVPPSNIPAGGSPRNLNVEFLPGLTRTRGGLQPQQGFGNASPYASIAGGPWQVRWVDDYATAPESPSQMVLLVNPTLSGEGIVAIGGTVIGNVYGYANQAPWAPTTFNPAWTGPLAKASTQFGRKYIAISDGRYGYDLPRQWDGTNYDRVSQCGPGAPPTVADGAFPTGFPIQAASVGLVEIPFSIFNITEANGLATIQFLSALTGVGAGSALLQAGDSIKITGNTVSGYNTTVQLISVDAPGRLAQFATAASGTGTGGSADGGVALVNFGPVTQAQAGLFAVGAKVQVAGAGVGAYNATPFVRQAAQPPIGSSAAYPQSVFIFVIYAGVYGLTNSGGGTVSPPSGIVAGLRQCAVSFITRQGYITRPSPPFSWNTAGSLLANVSNIPTGPSNVVARLLLFTPYLTPPATTGTFYSIRQTDSPFDTVMQIDDNTTTTLNLNFTDSDLAAGFNAQYLFGLIELGECAGCFPYAGRMFWWGELNSLQDFLSMEFNGGWRVAGGTGGSDVPLGWASDAAYGAGGSRVANGGVWLDAYQIAGNGLATPAGMIEQSAYQNYLGNALLNPSTSYSVRVTGKQPSPSAGILRIDLYSPTAGQVAILFAQGVGALDGSAGFGTIMSNGVALPAQIPADTLLRIYAVNLEVGKTITLDRVEIYPTSQPINYTALRASYASDPESFDGVTGLIQPVFTNGQALRAVYTLRDSFYLGCGDKGSTFVTKDTGGEPATWAVDPVSNSVGCCGPNAVAAGEDWEVKVNRYGMYIYIAREPEKISQEIQTLWNKEGIATCINWAAGYKIWVTVDLLNKRVYVGAPVGAAVECNTLFVMDYNFLDTSDAIAGLPTLRFSIYSGRAMVMPQGRKWTQWTFQLPGGGQMAVPCGAFVEQPGNVARFLLGGAADNNVYVIDPAMRGNDNGAAVTSSYATHFFPTSDEEQMLKLRSHMHGFSFGRFYVQGAGKMAVTAYHNSLSDPGPARASVDLRNPALMDAENVFDDFTAERYALEWTTNTLGSWFQMERLTRVVEQGTELVRGTNLQ